MATFRGFLRDLDRMQRRSAKESARAHKLYVKAQELQYASNAFDTQTNWLHNVSSLHKKSLSKINWKEIKEEDYPLEPVLAHKNEENAIRNFTSYAPSFIDKIFNLQNWRKNRLEKKILKGKELDEKIFANESFKYSKDIAEWKETQRLSNGIINNDEKVMVECFGKFFDKDSLTNMAENVKFEVSDNTKSITLTVKIREIDDMIPQDRLSLTSTGKLTKRSFPVSKRNELYQDYICSVVLRVARDIYSIYSKEKFIVNAVDDLVNQATGHLEEQCLLSVLFVGETISMINFQNVDASSCIKNFKHNMRFSKLKGMEAVSPLSFNS